MRWRMQCPARIRTSRGAAAAAAGWIDLIDPTPLWCTLACLMLSLPLWCTLACLLLSLPLWCTLACLLLSLPLWCTLACLRLSLRRLLCRAEGSLQIPHPLTVGCMVRTEWGIAAVGRSQRLHGHSRRRARTRARLLPRHHLLTLLRLLPGLYCVHQLLQLTQLPCPSCRIRVGTGSSVLD
jgi:hypothetical protein